VESRPPDFPLSATALMPSTVSPRRVSSFSLNVTASGGLYNTVGPSCSVQPSPVRAPTCSINYSSVAPGTPATLTVRTTAPTAAVMSSRTGSGLFFALGLPLIGLVVTRVSFSSKQKSGRQHLAASALACLLFASLFFQVACGGSGSTATGSKGTPTGTYTITVTGTYSTGSLVHSTPTTLRVQ
jgi:hypothetical protein